MQWWKILLIILFLPIAVIYYGFKYAIKFMTQTDSQLNRK